MYFGAASFRQAFNAIVRSDTYSYETIIFTSSKATKNHQISIKVQYEDITLAMVSD